MNALRGHVRHTPLLWLLVFVFSLFAAEQLRPGAHSLLFVLTLLAIVRLAAPSRSARARTDSTSRWASRWAARPNPLFVAPVRVLVSCVIGPGPMDRQFWPGAIVMVFLARIIATMVTRCGRSAWSVGVFLLMVNLILALTLLLMPPRAG